MFHKTLAGKRNIWREKVKWHSKNAMSFFVRKRATCQGLSLSSYIKKLPPLNGDRFVVANIPDLWHFAKGCQLPRGREAFGEVS